SLFVLALGVFKLEILVENRLVMLGGDARTGVDHANLHAAVVKPAGFERDAAGAGELGGVADQVADDPRKLYAVGAHDDVRVGRAGNEIHALVAQLRQKRPALVVDELRNREFGFGQLDPAGVKPRQVEHVADQPHQRQCAAFHVAGDVIDFGG